jgi:hypothetical protein
MVHLIRSLQRAEGKTDCFGKFLAECDQLECDWWKHCRNHQVQNSQEGIPNRRDLLKTI